MTAQEDVKGNFKSVIGLIQESLMKPEKMHLIYIDNNGYVDGVEATISDDMAEFAGMSQPYFQICTVNFGGNGLIQNAGGDSLDADDEQAIQEAFETASAERQRFCRERAQKASAGTK